MVRGRFDLVRGRVHLDLGRVRLGSIRLRRDGFGICSGVSTAGSFVLLGRCLRGGVSPPGVSASAASVDSAGASSWSSGASSWRRFDLDLGRVGLGSIRLRRDGFGICIRRLDRRNFVLLGG